MQTVLDLAKADVPIIRKRWGVVPERTVRELQSISCIALEEVSGPRKEIACTRSFGHPVTLMLALIEAVTEFATRAAIKLRTQKSLVNQVVVFAHTSPFKPVARFSRNCVVPLPAPTWDTRQIVGAAVAGVRRMCERGYQLSKADVILLDLQPEGVHQGMLDLGDLQEYQTALMSALDDGNRRFGRGTISVARGGTPQDSRGWHMRQERKTPSYTTSWTELAVVRT